MPFVEASIDIRRPCEEVLAFVMDPANATRYDPAILRYETLDGSPIRLGSRLRIVARFLPGIPSTVVSEVTAWAVEGDTRRVVFATKTGPITARGVHTFTRIPDGTHYTWAMEWDPPPGPVGPPLDALMHLVWAGKLRQPLANLKRLLEAQPPHP